MLLLLPPGCDKRFTEVFFSGNLPGGLVREQTDIFIMHTASSSACGKGRDYRGLHGVLKQRSMLLIFIATLLFLYVEQSSS